MKILSHFKQTTQIVKSIFLCEEPVLTGFLKIIIIGVQNLTFMAGKDLICMFLFPVSFNFIIQMYTS